jgi:hypothetical protein
MDVARAPPENPSRIDLGPHTCMMSSPLQGIRWTHKEIIEQDIERSNNEQRVRGNTHQSLSLKVSMVSARLTRKG